MSDHGTPGLEGPSGTQPERAAHQRTRKFLVVGTLLCVLAVAATTFWLARADAHPTHDDRVACGALRDVGDVLVAANSVEPIQSAIAAMTTAANRTDDTKLIQASALLRVAISAYRDSLDANPNQDQATLY